MEIEKAALTNNVKDLIELIKKKSVLDEFGVKALMTAAKAGHVKCVSILMEAGVDINQMNGDGMTALLCACQNGHMECVQLLIEAGGNEELRNITIRYFGTSALVIAARNGQIKCISWLLNLGINVNGSDMDGMRPLTAACERDHRDCASLLIDAGADVNLKTCGRFVVSHTTALISAAERGSLDCVHLLLEAGADVNTKNGMNSTPLLSAIIGSHVECVRYLADEPDVDFDAIGSSDYSALFESIRINHPDCLEILLKNERVDVNIRDPHGLTILMFAIICSPSSAHKHLQLILELRLMDINASDILGKTALVYAVEYGSKACVDLLLAVDGVNVNVKFSDIHCQCTKATPLSTACDNGDSEIVLALLKAGASVENLPSKVRNNPLMLMAGIGNIQYTKILLQAGLSAIKCDNSNKNSLYFAARNSHFECLQILINTLSDPDKTSTSMKNLILQSGIKAKIFQRLSIFLDAGLFHWDWYGDYFELALRSFTKFLTINSYVPEKFMLTEKDVMTSTPLHYAFIRNDLGLIRYLLGSLYLTPYDLSHFHKDRSLFHHVNTSGSKEVKAIHSNLYNSPWRLEVLSFLTVSHCLRRDKKRVDVINNSKLKILLPEKIQIRLAFQNQYQMLDIEEWDDIPVDNLQLDLKRLFLEDAESESRTVALKFFKKYPATYHDYTFHDSSSESSQGEEYSIESEDSEDDANDMEFVIDGTDPLHISFDSDADSGN